jgi:hypothetical protein
MVAQVDEAIARTFGVGVFVDHPGQPVDPFGEETL